MSDFTCPNCARRFPTLEMRDKHVELMHGYEVSEGGRGISACDLRPMSPTDPDRHLTPTCLSCGALPTEACRQGADMSEQHDAVNHPKHYVSHPSGIECIQVTEHMGFNLGNATKYIWRADLKNNALEDLRKAVWYIEREIDKRERLSTQPHKAD